MCCCVLSCRLFESSSSHSQNTIILLNKIISLSQFLKSANTVKFSQTQLSKQDYVIYNNKLIHYKQGKKRTC